jgi:hypothetical protein
MSELWRNIEGRAGYQVSDCGRVKRLSRSVQYAHGKKFCPHVVPERILKPWPNKYGHLKVGIGESIKRYVHVLVLEAFRGPCPEGHESRHLDGNAGNNRLGNLVWGTPTDNQNDRATHGTSNRGERQWMHKLTRDNVTAIRATNPTGTRQRSLIGQRFGVSQATVYAIVNRRTWAWL